MVIKFMVFSRRINQNKIERKAKWIKHSQNNYAYLKFIKGYDRIETKYIYFY